MKTKISGLLLFGLFSAFFHASAMSEAAYASAAQDGDHAESDLAEIPADQCNSGFPHPGWLARPFDTSSPAGTFKLFYFSPTAFDPAKPSVLYISGGPGGVVLSPEGFMSFLKKDYNLIFAHMRAAGCSQFPPSKSLDRFITTESENRDYDALREHLGINQWTAIIGGSYGTASAQVYAHLFPTRVKMLLMEGVFTGPGGGHYTGDRESIAEENVIRIVDFYGPRYRLTPQQISVIDAGLRQVAADCRAHSETLYHLIAKRAFEDPGKIAIFPWLSKGEVYLNAIELSGYTGWAEDSLTTMHVDDKILAAVVDTEFPGTMPPQDHEAAWARFAHTFTSSVGSMPLSPTPWFSQRVFGAIAVPNLANYTHTVPAVLINGTGDQATPAADARYFYDNYLGGHAVLATIGAAGHPNSVIPEECQQLVYPYFLRGQWDDAVEILSKSIHCYFHEGLSVLKK